MLYRLLNENAKAWWAHKALRASGETAEARRRERRSIKSAVANMRETLENKGCLTIGRYGHTLHVSDSLTVSSMGRKKLEAIRYAGITIIDSRTVPEEKLVEFAVRRPLIRPGAKEKPGPFNYVDTATAVEYARAYGATIHNFPQKGA